MRPTFARIDLENLRFNFRSSRDFIGHDVKYMAVVKANAYGHGAVECSRVLEADGVDWFGVALLEEAVELRDAGIQAPILCLGGPVMGQEAIFLDRDITPVIFSVEQARALNAKAAKRNMKAAIHIKIDTGMGRLGVRCDHVGNFIDELKPLNNLRVEAMMTHFASADDLREKEFTELQIDRFHEAVKQFEAAGIRPDFVDLANSPGAVAHPRSRPQMVRLGGILYGLGGDILPAGVPKPDLKPVMSLHSAIADVKPIPKGETLGYGRTYTTKRDSMIALIPIGYHDGYRRALSNNSEVIINGQFAPVVGRVSMDWTIVDVTDVPNVATGNEVILIGSCGDLQILAENLAARGGTISYEITCGISRRVPREHVH